MHFSRNPVQRFLQVGVVLLKQVDKFKYLIVAFTNDGRLDKELDVRTGKASAEIRALHHSVVLKQELLKKAKLSVFKLRYLPPSSSLAMNLG